jgi:metallo-beta-lactamase class B
MKPASLALTAAFAALATAASAASNPTWTAPAKPFHIIGPIYDVGSAGLVVLMIKTSAGVIVIDGGMPGWGGHVEDNIKALGVPLKDVKILLNSHAHFDHSGGLAQIKHDTGATLMAAEGDRSALESGKYLGSEDNRAFDSVPVKVDRPIRDGETVTLGDVTLTAHLTPGHTRGCTSWTLPVVDRGVKHTAIFLCSTSVAANRLAPKAQYPGIIADYRSTFAKAKKIDADIFLAPHAEMFDLQAKRARLAKGGPNPFIVPGEYRAYVDKSAKAFDSDLARQRAAAK